jgi:hypothetical protein
MSSATASSSASWQQQQKQTATSTQVKKPDIPGDYGGQLVPDLPPGTEKFTDRVSSSQSTAWFITVGAAAVALIFLCGINLKRR